MAAPLRKGLRALIRTAVTADNPPTGQRLLYPKTDGWYDRDSTGVETNLNLSGGSSASIKVAEVNVGTIARDQFTTTVTDAAITATSKIMAMQAGEAATGKTADENEMESFGVIAIPAAGSMTVKLDAFAGSLLQGYVRFYYMIG